MTGKRNPSGEGSVYRRKSDGKWCAAVTLPSGKRKTIYGVDEKDALRKRRKLLAEIEAGRPVTVGRDPTLGEHLSWWLAVFVPGQVEAGHLDASTAESYREKIEIHVLPTDIAKAKRNRVSTEDVREWQRERLRAISSLGKPYSARSVGMAHGAVRRALNDAMRDEIIGRNVFALVPLPAGQSKPAEAPTEEDAARVFVEMVDDKRRVLWLTMLALGPRRGEALGMRWSLTDLDRAKMRLHKQIRRVRDAEADPETGRRRGRLVEKALKTTESRATLALPAALVDLLREHRREQIAARLAARVWVDPDLIFTSRIGTPLEPRGVNRAWAAVCKRAGVTMRLHDLRHLAASLAFAEGASIKEVQSMLRHTRQATTADIYVHVFESVRSGTADKMDGVLRKIVGA